MNIKTKARTLFTLILLNEVPERPFQQEQTITSTPDMYYPPAQFGRGLNITYPRGRLLYNLVSGSKFARFQ